MNDPTKVGHPETKAKAKWLAEIIQDESLWVNSRYYTEFERSLLNLLMNK